MAIERLADSQTALEACALVEVASGMVLHSAGGQLQQGGLAEACADYWRLYQRNSEFFEPLGPLRYCVLMHRQQRLTVLMCASGVVLVLLSRDGVPIDWTLTLAAAGEIGRLASAL